MTARGWSWRRLPFPECTTEFPEKVYLPGYHWQHKANPEQLCEAAELIRQSKRPLLYLGGGCVASGAHEAAKATAIATAVKMATDKLRIEHKNTLARREQEILAAARAKPHDAGASAPKPQSSEPPPQQAPPPPQQQHNFPPPQIPTSMPPQ